MSKHEFREKIVSIVIILFVMAVLVANTYSTTIRTERRLQKIEEKLFRGQRKDPFRCSDAKRIFKDYEIDCNQIECEVNNNCV